ncbi:hemolysin family protein [Erysipelothrix urinaevulpis]|uniref:hemolysin family protein n=1 Tax=Erysipelothrix urinaevulpis TaxID=2683717 RepID=UPI00135B47BD|nr:hemolysin family protein [Erysipelothrix urinaevulpis]
MMVQVALLLLLVLFNGFFSGSEIAFISINNSKLKSMAEEGHKKAKIVLSLKEVPNLFLSTIQIGVSLASVLSGVFASEAFATELSNWILTFSNVSITVIKPLSMFLITLITSYLMLVFGELVPKRIAMSNPEGFAFVVVYPLWVLSKISNPIVKFLSFSTNLVLRLVGIDPDKVGEEVTEEEIRIMVDAGEINISEKEMINNIFEFDNLEVSDIMTHRTEVVALESTANFEEVMNLVNEERYTRYPVYEENMDNVIGIIHLRDLLRYIRKNGGHEFVMAELIREPYFVPDSKRTDQLFKELQNHKTHMAIVIDEYGGTAGIVTMEDLIEEIMGNILDEYDDEEDEYDVVAVHEGEYLVDGATDIEDLEEVIEIGLPIDDYDTVSGFIIGQLGRIPTLEDVEEDTSDFVYHGYLFSIVDVDEKVISKVRVTQHEDYDDEEEEAE